MAKKLDNIHDYVHSVTNIRNYQNHFLQ